MIKKILFCLVLACLIGLTAFSPKQAIAATSTANNRLGTPADERTLYVDFTVGGIGRMFRRCRDASRLPTPSTSCAATSSRPCSAGFSHRRTWRITAETTVATSNASARRWRSHEAIERQTGRSASSCKRICQKPWCRKSSRMVQSGEWAPHGRSTSRQRAVAARDAHRDIQPGGDTETAALTHGTNLAPI